MRSLYFTNRKEYYRRKKISLALKSYWSDVKAGKIIRGKRIRKQVAYNSNYNISIRAIQINGKKTYDELRQDLESFLESNPYLTHIFYEGLENEEIDNDEDKSLKSGVTYIEVNIRGDVTLTEL